MEKQTDKNPGYLVDTYKKGKLYKYGPLHVVELHGNYRDMGRQYGALRKDVLNEIYQIISKDNSWLSFFKIKDMNDLEQLNIETYTPYPDYNEIIQGIAETSGLGNKAYVVASIMKELYIMQQAMLNAQSQGQCSFNAVWGDYTENSQMIVGRNYDLGPDLANYTEIVVYNFDDGTIPVAILGYVGSVYVTSVLNKEGVFLELNNGEVCAHRLENSDLSWKEFLEYLQKNLFKRPEEEEKLKPDPNLELFKLAQNSANLNELDKNFQGINTPGGIIINVASTDGSYSYEWAPQDNKRRNPDKNGALAATNWFVNQSWGLEPVQPGSEEDMISSWSMIRRTNILNLNENNRGQITPKTMQEIMSTPLEEGGPFVDQGTSYQMVIKPEELKVWFKVPDHMEWTFVDLRKHFSHFK